MGRNDLRDKGLRYVASDLLVRLGFEVGRNDLMNKGLRLRGGAS